MTPANGHQPLLPQLTPQDPRERLAETIRALERGEYAGSNNAIATDQSVPWDIAYHVAVHREAGKLPDPTPSHLTARRTALGGKHAGPAALLNHRRGPAAGGPAKSHGAGGGSGVFLGPPATPGIDPFNRAPYGVTNPLEASWRTAVSVEQARRTQPPGTSASRPPFTAAASLPIFSPTEEGGKGGYTTWSVAQQQASWLAAGADGGTNEVVKNRGADVMTLVEGIPQTESILPHNHTDQLVIRQQQVQKGWGVSPSRLDEVPEPFWRTVAPDVHHEIAEYVFEQDVNQHKYIRAMLEAVHARRRSPWGALPASNNFPRGQRVGATDDIDSVETAMRVPAGEARRGAAALKVSVAAVAATTHIMPIGADRRPGTAAVSRWRHGDGSWEWMPCTLLKPASDGSTFLIRWSHTAAIKEVSRFNILFGGEDETSLEALLDATQRHQARVDEAIRHEARVDDVPPWDLTDLPEVVMDGILARIGLSLLQHIDAISSVPEALSSPAIEASQVSITGSRSGAELIGMEGSAVNLQGGGGIPGSLESHRKRRASKQSPSGTIIDAYLRLNDEAVQRRHAPLLEDHLAAAAAEAATFMGSSSAAAAVAAASQLRKQSFHPVNWQRVSLAEVRSATGKSVSGLTNRNSTSGIPGDTTHSNSPHRLALSAGHHGAAGAAAAWGIQTSRLHGSNSSPDHDGHTHGIHKHHGGGGTHALTWDKQFSGWQMTEDGSWRMFGYGLIESLIDGMLQETSSEFRRVHARLAYRAQFEAETGLQLPPGLDLNQMLMELPSEVSASSRGMATTASVLRPHPSPTPKRQSSDAAFIEMVPSQNSLSSRPASASASCTLRSPLIHRLKRHFESSTLSDPFIMNAWQQTQRYLVDIMHRDMFALNDLPLKSAFLTSDTSLKDRARYKVYLSSRRTAMLQAEERAGDLRKHSVALSGVHDTAITTSLVAFLNVQEGARHSEITDLQERVLQQLANIVMDSAQDAFDTSAAMAVAAMLPFEREGLESTEIPKLPVHVPLSSIISQSAPANGGGLSSHHDARPRLPPFDPQRHQHGLARLINLAVQNTLQIWMEENITMYIEGLSLYSSPSYHGAALLNVTLDAAEGGVVHYSPPLASLNSRLIESITLAIADVNSLPGLKVEQNDSKSSNVPFKVEVGLCMPLTVDPQCGVVAKALQKIQGLVNASSDQCDQLLTSFSRHLATLASDGAVLKQSLEKDRGFISKEEWLGMVQRFRLHQDEIMQQLPIEAELGLYHVDCRALRFRLQDGAKRLSETCLFCLHEDAVDYTQQIISLLQEMYEALSQPLKSLASLSSVKLVLSGAASAVLDQWMLHKQLKLCLDVLEALHYELPDEVFGRAWSALRLPTLITEQIEFLKSGGLTEAEEILMKQLMSDKESFQGKINEISQDLKEWQTAHDEALTTEYVEMSHEQASNIKSLIEYGEQINTQEVLAGVDVTNYHVLKALKRQLAPYTELWKLVKAFKEGYQSWMYGPIFNINIENLEANVPAWTKMAAKLAKDLRGSPQGVAQKYSTLLLDFQSHMPLLRALRTQGMRQRHWTRIHKDLPQLGRMDKTQLTLHAMLQAGMHTYVGMLKELADLAARELVIEQSVESIRNAFMDCLLVLKLIHPAGIAAGIPSLVNANDLLRFIDDAQLRIKGLSTSVYVEPHKEAVLQWDDALNSVRAIIEQWLEVQTKWEQLAPLFGPSGLSGQLLLEARRFNEVTVEWKNVCKETVEHGRLSELLRYNRLPGMLKELGRGLESVYKGVMEFLEEKRANFPRFYFLSNNEMVEVLVRSHDPASVEPYLQRCFPGIHKIKLSHQWGVRIDAIISQEGEVLPLQNPVNLMDYSNKHPLDVEAWMMELEKQMRIAVRASVSSCLEQREMQLLDDWLLGWSAQSLLLTSAIVWCNDVTKIYREGPPVTSPLERLEHLIAENIGSVVDVILTRNLSSLQHGCIENFIIAEVYHKDVTQRLREQRTSSSSDIEWLRVVRFYLEGDMLARCGYSTLEYGLEYLGNGPRLIITPLTERALSSLITAVHLHYGGAPEGPAGTGKTETVKELARQLGRQCVVFNTTEKLDVQHMRRLLVGITTAGAWACFDEFNRMDMEVLSVVAKQIMTIQAALASGDRFTMFDGRNIGVHKGLALFITMNPTYEFRNVLPSNLKALFRPVAMMVPDYRLIAEVSLYANGYQSAAHLAVNLVSALKIASHRLSGQIHYDFAMRTLKSVLVISAFLRKTSPGNISSHKEASLVRIALLRCNLSKLRTEDVPVFMGVVDREFPEPGSADQYLEVLKTHVIQSANEQKLHPTPELVSRALQTHSMLQIRTGILLLGPAACGKSTVLKVLKGAISKMPEEHGGGGVTSWEIFPKAMGASSLFGANHANTQTWSDGVITAAMRAASIKFALNEKLAPTVKGRSAAASPTRDAADSFLKSLISGGLASGPAPPPPEGQVVRTASPAPAAPEPETPIDIAKPGSAVSGVSLSASIPTTPSGTKSTVNMNKGELFDCVPEEGAEGTTTLEVTHTDLMDPTYPPDALILPSSDVVDDGETLLNSDNPAAPEVVGQDDKFGWVVLDGPVDPLWVEMLNPVLDDNRTLCLNTGETISLREGVNIIMEVDSIARASPATISRCGIVYMDKVTELWRPIISTWLTTLKGPLVDYIDKIEVTLMSIFGELIKAYSDALEPDPYNPRQQPSSVLISMLRLLDSLLPEISIKMAYGISHKDTSTCLEAAMVFAMVWSFEPSLMPKARAFFNILVRQMCVRTLRYKVVIEGVSTDVSSMGFNQPIPPEGTVWDYMFDFDEVKWVSWHNHVHSLLEQPSLPRGMTAFLPLGINHLLDTPQTPEEVRSFVFSTDCVPAIYITRLLLSGQGNILMVGPTGTGKTSLSRAVLMSASDWLISEDRKRAMYSERAEREAEAAALLAAETEATSLLTKGPIEASSTGAEAGSADPEAPIRSTQRPLSRSLSATLQQLNAASGFDEDNEPIGSPFEILYTTLSSQSGASDTKHVMETFLMKRRKNVLGPPVGKTAIMFVDDLNTAGADLFGTRATVELLRQWCSVGGWHDEGEDGNGGGLNFKTIVDTKLLACITTSPYQKTVSARFLQHCSLVQLPAISLKGFQLIFTAMLRRHMQNVTTMGPEVLPSLVAATLELYRHVTSHMLPVPSRPHYLFSIRHVASVFKAMFHAHRGSRAIPEQLVLLWQHECARVFQDRISDTATREWFNKTLHQVSTEQLSMYCPKEEPTGQDVLFCTFASRGTSYYEQAEMVLNPNRILNNVVLDSATSYLSTLGVGTPEVIPGTPMSRFSSSTPPPETPPPPPAAVSTGSRDLVISGKRKSRAERLKSLRNTYHQGGGGSSGNSSPMSPLKAIEGEPSLSVPGAVHGKAGGGGGKGSRPGDTSGGASPRPPESPGAKSRAETPELTTPVPDIDADHPLHILYNTPWVEDGETTKAMAVQQRLVAICEAYAKEMMSSIGESVSGKSTSTAFGSIDTVIFKQALVHVSRVARILSMEQGHMILLGAAGSGRRTLCRLAAYISGMQLFEANLKDEQGGFSWRESLKQIMYIAGVQGRPSCLLLVEVDRPAGTMLDDVNQIMSSGHLPGLFSSEDIKTIIKQVKPAAKTAGIQWSDADRTGATDNLLLQFFIERCRANVHVLLVMEQQEQALQAKVTRFPKMFHMASINYMDDWDREARLAVARRVLVSPEDLLLPPNEFEEVIVASVEMHDAAKRVTIEFNSRMGGIKPVIYATSCQFLLLLHHIRQQLPLRRSALSKDREKYQEGVEKMNDMSAKLKRLQEEVAAMQPKLLESQLETTQIMTHIRQERGDAEAMLEAIQPEEEQAKIAAAKKAVLVQECEEALGIVMPPLEKAIKGLKSIDKGSIAELKVMKSPPAGVKLVMRSICILLDQIPMVILEGKIRDDEQITQAWWNESVKVLSDFHFLDKLRTYNKDSMTQEMAKQVATFVSHPSFDPAVVMKSSVSAAALCKWVRAMDLYQKAKEIVDPKKAALEEAAEEMKIQEEKLKDARERLAQIQKTIAELEEKYLLADAAKQRLQVQLDIAQSKVNQAHKVQNAVRQEVERWQLSRAIMDAKHQQVLGETLLSSGYLAYLGPLPGSYRKQVETVWMHVLEQRKIVCGTSFSLQDVLGEVHKLEHWRDSNLPQSKTSIENALIMQQSPQWQLLIDPQELGNTFLKAYYGGEGMVQFSTTEHASPLKQGQLFVTLGQSDPAFKESLLRAIEMGSVLLLENLDEDMGDAIEQMLQQLTFQNHLGQRCIKIGEASAILSADFKLFVTTRIRTPRFPFMVLRNLSVVNFSITRAQMTELLITATLRHEMPELEQEHGQLTRQKVKNESELAVLEMTMLKAITVTSTEALLGESEVFDMLMALQQSSNSIKAKVAGIEKNQKRIADVRVLTEQHLVSRVCTFFFVLMEMSHVRNIYQFSLKWFMDLFSQALTTCPRSNAGKDRLNSLTLFFVSILYTNTSRSLFDEDKLPFAVFLMTRYMVASGKALKDEGNLLLFGRTSTEGKATLSLLLDSRALNKKKQADTPSALFTSSSMRRTSHSGQGPTTSTSRFGGNRRTSNTGASLQLGGAKEGKGAEDDGNGTAFDSMFKRAGNGSGSAAQATSQSRLGNKALPAVQEDSESDQKGVVTIGSVVEGDDGDEGSIELTAYAKEGLDSPKLLKKTLTTQSSTTKRGSTIPAGISLLSPSASAVPDFLELSLAAELPESMRPEWLPMESWERLQDLGKIFPYNRTLPELFDTPEACAAMEQYYVQLTENGYTGSSAPKGRLRELSPFQMLVFVRCYQPSAFISAALPAIADTLGPSCAAVSEPLDMDAAFSVSDCTAPIVVISSVDQPLPQLLQFAERRAATVLHVAMGRGQGVAADRLIRSSVAQPVWVVLENTQLAGDWLPSLCSLVQSLPSMRPNNEFRLWLTIEPTEEFPSVILQAALKLVFDPPMGLKANLLQVMSQLPAEISMKGRSAAKSDARQVIRPISSSAAILAAAAAAASGQNNNLPLEEPGEDVPWRRLILRLCLFHALLMERRQYKGLGWRQQYEFSAADFLAAVKQAVNVQADLGNSETEFDLEEALPGLLYVDGQCLYGGKVTHDWDRRLLVTLLAQQVTGAQSVSQGLSAFGATQGPSTATVDTILPERLASCCVDLAMIMRELRVIEIDPDNPCLIGLTQGAAVVRHAQKTRGVLQTLRRVQMTSQAAGDGVSDSSRPMQAALSVIQDISRQLPFTVLPSVQSAWVAKIKAVPGATPSALVRASASGQAGKRTPPGAGIKEQSSESGKGANADTILTAGPPPVLALENPGSFSKTSGTHAAGGSGSGTSQASAVNKFTNRARQLKMHENMSEAALKRWEAMDEVEQKAMIQVFNVEVSSYQGLLRAVHATAKTVAAAARGLEPANAEVLEMIRNLANNQVPKQWLSSGPELNSESVVTWVGDLQERLDFLYSWAVEGPPVVVPLGMMARPKTYLTAVLQIHAERLDCSVGSLAFDCHVMMEGASDLSYAPQLTPDDMENVLIHMSCEPGGGAGLEGMAADGTMLGASGDAVLLSDVLLQGCLVSGSVLQGARWDTELGELEEADVQTIYSPMPLLWLRPVDLSRSPAAAMMAAGNVGADVTALRNLAAAHSDMLQHQQAASKDAAKQLVNMQRPSMAASDLSRPSTSAIIARGVPSRLTSPSALASPLSPLLAPGVSGPPPSASFRATDSLLHSAQSSRADTPVTPGQGRQAIHSPITTPQALGLTSIGNKSKPTSARPKTSGTLIRDSTMMSMARKSGRFPGEGGQPPAMLGGWQYICPVYSHSTGDGSSISPAAAAVRQTAADVDDCLFTVGLAPGVFSAEHWTARNVALLVCSNPAMLLNASRQT